MIRIALGLELRNLARSPLRVLVLALVVAVGGVVTIQGQNDVDRWNRAIEEGVIAQNNALAEARAWFSEGENRQQDRPWIDLRQAHWQDIFAATRIVRAPEPLAGIAFASAEAGAITMRLNRFADPLVAQGDKIENPALAAAGGLDLVTVLSLLIPLLVLALGVEVGGYERASGLLPLVQVQTGRDRSWIWARCFAIGLIVATVALVLCTLATAAAGAGPQDALPLYALALVYVGIWTAILAVVGIVSRNPSHGAVGLGSAWIFLCVLVPSLGVERSAALAADDFALDLTIEARDSRNDAYEMNEDELYALVYDRWPALRDKEPRPRRAGILHARDGVRIVGLESRLRQRVDQGQAHRQLVESMLFASPALVFTHALERLAGRSPASAQAFREAAVDAVANRTELVIGANWSQKALGNDDFETLVKSSPRVAPMPIAAWHKDLLVLVLWLLLLAGLANLLPRRMSQS
ncbi:MAG TPA: hypothetical protein DDW23_06930 [Planctomycetes bacterium]|nr:hypothetical protein [Planctomycetota bacterium]